MTTRKIKFKPNETIEKCLKCGNNIEFTVISDQCAEDCCEICAKCVCGFDPSGILSDYRVEDVMGGVDDDNCKDAVCLAWNEVIADLREETAKIEGLAFPT